MRERSSWGLKGVMDMSLERRRHCADRWRRSLYYETILAWIINSNNDNYKCINNHWPSTEAWPSFIVIQIAKVPTSRPRQAVRRALLLSITVCGQNCRTIIRGAPDHGHRIVMNSWRLVPGFSLAWVFGSQPRRSGDERPYQDPGLITTVLLVYSCRKCSSDRM